MKLEHNSVPGADAGIATAGWESGQFDYVVIGAGSAGCVLAARLSEDPTRGAAARVRSGRQQAGDRRAAGWPALWGTEVDYAYDTVPQPGTGGVVAQLAARPHPRRLEQHQRDGVPARAPGRLRRLGRRPAAPAGTTSRCCRTSGAWRRSAAGIRSTAATAGRCVPAPFGPAEPAVAGLPRRGGRAAGFPLTDDFNGAVAEGAGWHDLSIADGHAAEHRGRLPAPGPGQPAQPHRLDRSRVPAGCCSTATAASVSSSTAAASRSPRTPTPRWWSARARSTRPGCCSCPVSGRPPSSRRRVSRLCTTCPASAATCTTTRCAAWSTRRASRSRRARPTTPRRRCCGAATSLPGPDMQLMFIHVPFHLPHLPAPANSFTFGVATVPEARGSIRLAGAGPGRRR